MDFRADMHTHTTCSDGTFSPKELIELAVKEELSGLSITDHDTVAAYTPELFAFAEEKGIRLCTGAEFSCSLYGENVHILGYNVDVNDPGLLDLCKRHEMRRKTRNQAIITDLKKRGMPLPEEKVKELFSSEGVIGRPHIAALLVEEGYVSTIYDAFSFHLGDEHVSAADGTPFPVQETLDVIHGASGKAFMAHPQLIKGKKVISSLFEMEFDGIECYYGNLHPHRMQKWINAVKERRWLFSGGSDFHGRGKEGIGLGSAWIGQEAFSAIVRLSGVTTGAL